MATTDRHGQSMMERLSLLRRSARRPTSHEPTRGEVMVLGATMSYLEIGNGWPIVFVHGNFTTSYVWRNVLPNVDDLGHAVAIDLIGMGRSERIARGPLSYRLDDQRTYFDAFMDVVGFDGNVVLVGIEWGATIAVDWARRNPQAVRGIAYMEPYLSGVTWRDVAHAVRPIMRAIREDADGQMILDSDIAASTILPTLTDTPLARRTIAEFLIGYHIVGESRRAAQSLMLEVPIRGEPAGTEAVLAVNEEWMASTQIPKLRILGDPGLFLAGKKIDRTSAYPEQTTAHVMGRHLLPEEDPDGVSEALARWLWKLS